MATRWACLGPGSISSDFFQSIQENLPATEHEFTAIVDREFPQFISVASRDKAKAQKFADKFKFKRAFDSYDEIAQDKEVDVVYIGTLHTTHAELSIKMLEAGKHVLCEKPMALNWKQAEKVLATAKQNKKYFMEAVWSRFFPVYDQIRKEKAAGTLGEIRLVSAEFCMPIAEVPRLKLLELGGGGTLDIGIYTIQFACFVYGNKMPKQITAIGNLTDTGVDEGAVVILQYEDGAIANLVYHTDAGVGRNTACVQGKKGRVEIDGPFWAPTKMTTPSGVLEFPLKGEYNFFNSAGLHYEAAATRECLLKGETENKMMSHKDSEVIHKILTEVRRQLGVKYPEDE